jgi:hypothetical protein
VARYEPCHDKDAKCYIAGGLVVEVAEDFGNLPEDAKTLESALDIDIRGKLKASNSYR